MLNIIQTIFADAEIRDYIAGMVDAGCQINYQILSEIERYRAGNIEFDDLINNLKCEWEFQCGS